MSEFMHIYCIYIHCISQALLFEKDLPIGISRKVAQWSRIYKIASIGLIWTTFVTSSFFHLGPIVISRRQ